MHSGRSYREGSVDPTGPDPRAALVRELVDRIDLSAVAPEDPHPDGYVYSFRFGPRRPVDVPEHRLTADLHRLAEIVLDD